MNEDRVAMSERSLETVKMEVGAMRERIIRMD